MATKNGTMKPRWGIGLVVLVVIGVFASDGVRTGLVKSSVSDDAAQVAHDAATNYHNSMSVDAAYAAAQIEAASEGTTIASTSDFSVTSTGMVTVVLTKTNNTLVLSRLDSSLKSFTATASSTWSP